MPHVIRARPRAASEGGGRSAAGRPGWRRRGCSAERGHEVVLFEAADRLGGQVNIAAKARRWREILGHHRAGWTRQVQKLRRRDPAQQLRRAPTRCWPWRPTSSSSPPAACRNTGLGRRATNLPSPRWDVLCRPGGPAANVLVYDEKRPARGLRRRVPGRRAAAWSRWSPSRPDAGDGDRRDQLGPVHLRELYAAGVLFVARPRAERDLPRGQPAGGRSGTIHRAEEERGSTRSWSSTARCRPTSSISRLKAGSRNQGEIDLEALIDGRPQAIDRTTPTAAISCSASATPSPAATSTPRSTTPCACARTSETGVTSVGKGCDIMSAGEVAATLREGRRGGRRGPGHTTGPKQLPWQQPRLRFPPMEVVSADELEIDPRRLAHHPGRDRDGRAAARGAGAAQSRRCRGRAGWPAGPNAARAGAGGRRRPVPPPSRCTPATPPATSCWAAT